MATAMHVRTNTAKVKRTAKVFLCLSLVLLVALGGLTAYTVVTLKEQRQITQTQSEELTALKSQLAGIESQQEQLDEANKKLEDATAQIKEQEDTIKKQDETIKKHEQTIKDLRAELAENGGDPDVEPLDQDLPERDYGDHAGEKLVALTFDDGPGPYTERLLGELKTRDIKATFFVLGERVSSYSNLIQRMEAEGHVVGNHSENHKNLTNLSAAGVRTEMETAAEKIQKLIGHKPEVMRCPGGNSYDPVKSYAKAAGIPILYWGVDTRDWESRNVNSILKVAFGSNGISNGSIVLMHDIYSTTVDAAIQMMDRLLEEGYTFVTVPELLKSREGSIEPGKVYY